MKINLAFSIIVIILSVYCSVTEGFAEKTHKAISEKAVINSQTDFYIKSELGLSQGLGTMLFLDQSLIPEPERIPAKQFETRIMPELPSNPCSIIDCFKAGANLEDVPNPRARHHFHAPIANTGVNPPNPNSGLDNKTDHPNLAIFFNTITLVRYPGYSFDLTGASAQKRAMGTEEPNWETEYQNYFAWPDTRAYLYRALTKSNLAGRNHYLALTFISLGQTAHLLEDMGVPAHTRNDFIFGHYRNVIDWGNPFENWTEEEIKSNNGNIPSAWLTGWISQPKVFDKLFKYWDTNLYDGNYSGVTPPSIWGLAEQTNYQFLSSSTVFDCEGTLYQFPNPAKLYTTIITETDKRYFSGYGVQHLARESYTHYCIDAWGYSEVVDSTITPDDESVYYDYARITMPRTIDYTTGLINYFFRGRLNAVLNCTNPDCSQMEIAVTNDSNNTNVPQALKGGIFELYWDNEEGTRTKITSFTVPGWGSASILNYGQSVTGQFTKPIPSSGHQISKYIIVYKGQISQNPADPDNDDLNAIATCIFDPPEPPPHIDNITPEMGCPGSVLLIEGSGFSPIPSENIVSFTDTNGILPVVYATVLEAAGDGTWLTVKLASFDAEDIDYYWTNAKVTADGSVSNSYNFRLTNYIWCTIFLWDCGESIDDEFDLYINEEYWLTSYQAPFENPTIAEVGFWYEDEYNFVDVYLYDSYEEQGGTLGIIIIPYVSRVIAHRWNSIAGLEEFLFDENFSGTFGGNFGSNVFAHLDDGLELDVYTALTYSGSMSLKSPDFIQITNGTDIDGAGERQGQIVPIKIDEIKRRPGIPRKRIKKYQEERSKNR